MTNKNPNITTLSAFGREVSQALEKMTFAQKVAFRFAVYIRTAGLRERILN